MRKLTEEECHKRLEGKTLKMIKYGGASHANSVFQCRICQHSWEACFCHIDKIGYCTKCAATEKTKRRLILDPEVIKSIEGRDIHLLVYSGMFYYKKSKFRCDKCSHVWKSMLGEVKKGTGCPKCAKKLTAKKKSFPVEELHKKLVGRHIHMLYYGGNIPRSKSTFKCDVCNHEWITTFGNIDRGRGCPKCNGGIKVPDEECFKRLKGRSLEMINYAGKTNGISEFRCLVCHHIWKTEFNSVNRGSGCPSCAKSGFNPSKPAWLYILLLDTPYGSCYGFGITSAIEDRIKLHRKNLQNMIDKEYQYIYFDSGAEAKSLEDKWKQSPYIVDIGIPGFRTECVLVNSETTKMIFG